MRLKAVSAVRIGSKRGSRGLFSLCFCFIWWALTGLVKCFTKYCRSHRDAGVRNICGQGFVKRFKNERVF
jgi:hypothetical protein